MASNQDQMKMSDEEESFLRAMQMPSGVVLGMVLKTAFELDLFEIMAKAGPNAQLSASEISSFLDTKNPQAPVMLDRILRFLAGQSYVICNLTTDEDGHVKRLYSLAPVCKAFLRNDDGVSLSPFVAVQLDKVFMETWYHLKDAILEGGIAFNRVYGMHAFEYPGIDSRFNEAFNKGMYNHTTIVMKKVLEVYKGFEGVRKMVDVGGGLGASLALIVSKYPNLKGINYDLPHVIKDAPVYSGVEHVAGDMFQSVPEAEVIFMKWILHDWSDEHCLKLLKNCWKALPESGKVIVFDSILPEYPKGDVKSTIGFFMDIAMMVANPGGKERTHKEFEALTKEAGFASFKPICPVYNYWAIELYKN